MVQRTIVLDSHLGKILLNDAELTKPARSCKYAVIKVTVYLYGVNTLKYNIMIKLKLISEKASERDML